MSFSAQWADVRADAANTDLALESATSMSPPLEQMTDDARAAVQHAADAAATIIDGLTPGPTGRFRVSASGHQRQGELDPSNTTVSLHELQES